MARMIDRGQTLLVGAIALAVLFVSLALVLNTAIYGSTIASQGSEDVTGGQTIAFQSAVERDVGHLIETAIEKESGWSSQSGYVQNRISRLQNHYRAYYAEGDRIVSLSHSGSPGTAGDYASKSGGDLTDDRAVNYNLTNDRGRLREFNIDVTGWGNTGPGDFTIIFQDDTGLTHRVMIYDGGPGTVIEHVDGDGAMQTCEYSDTAPTINVTDGRVNGEPCSALNVFDRVPAPYGPLEFRNADEIEGSFGLVANNLDTGGLSIDTEQRLYAFDVRLSERSTRIDYENTIRVAPGEPR